MLASTLTGGFVANSAASTSAPPGVVTVINVYESQTPWPPAVKIAALRIVELFPKATPNIDVPRVGIARQSLCRGVLGTVPVEADGSVQFLCPAGKAVYFQALDADGCAVQSMRSDTYVQPGQRLICQGCHENRQSAPTPPARTPLALQRPPSEIRPEADGSDPVSFPRLVQPVLDRQCAACHARSPKAPCLSTEVEPKTGWTRAYAALAPRGFWLNGGNGAVRDPLHGGSRSVPGHTGARVAPLFQMLSKGHHDLKLPPDDLHRLALWLDCRGSWCGRRWSSGGTRVRGSGFRAVRGESIIRWNRT